MQAEGFLSKDPSPGLVCYTFCLHLLVNKFFSRLGISMYDAHPNDGFHTIDLNWIPKIFEQFINLLNTKGLQMMELILKGDMLDIGMQGEGLYPRLRKITHHLNSMVGRDYKKTVHILNPLFKLLLIPENLKEGKLEEIEQKGFRFQT